MTQISVVATTAMNTVISLISAFFIISFFTFFMLKDGTVIYETLLLAIPVKHRQKAQNILDDTTTMLNKYFTAILIDIIVVSILISIGMSILGIHNAITIGILAGILNVIPYVGPLIGAVVAMIIGISTNLHLEFYSGLLPLAGKTGLVFLIVNSIDAFLLQPYIFSNSVKAHPIEIFTVILLGATIAGIPGMIAAVPVYTVLRIVAKEFLSHYHFIKKLTDDLDEATEPEVQRDKDYPEL
jgi:predicted PurR-regulated permease PerM